jgi:rhodanese-related sulfurtransferase
MCKVERRLSAHKKIMAINMDLNLKRYSLLIFILAFSSCSYAQKSQTEFDGMLDKLLSHSVKEVKPSDVSVKSDVVFLDTREKEEYEISHIENAIWIGFDNFDKKSLAKIPKSKPIVVYCSVGYRSEKITERMEKLGFKDVSSLYGGIFSWKDAGLKVVDSSGKPTEKVHTYNKKWSQWLKNGEKVY